MLHRLDHFPRCWSMEKQAGRREPEERVGMFIISSAIGYEMKNIV